MRLTHLLSVALALCLLTACVMPGKTRSEKVVNPITGTSVTVETIDEVEAPKPVKRKPVKREAVQSDPAMAAPVAPPAAAAPTEPAAEPGATAAPPKPRLFAKKPKKPKKAKTLPAPVAGQVDASEDAISMAEAATAEAAAAAAEATPANPEPSKAAPAPKSAQDLAAEALLAATQAEPEIPVELQTPEQARCLKKGGVWAVAGKSGARACVKPTRDAGKSCTKQTQCEGFCLARSGTCAPITPMFGCNDILQADGREVTLCLD